MSIEVCQAGAGMFLDTANSTYTPGSIASVIKLRVLSVQGPITEQEWVYSRTWLYYRREHSGQAHSKTRRSDDS